MSMSGTAIPRISSSIGCALLLATMSATLRRDAVAQKSGDRRAVTSADVSLLVTAIRDEIYVLGNAPAYIDIPTDSIRIYVEPRLEDGKIWVIYGLLPFGEVLRAAWLSPDERFAILLGDPREGFPPTHPTAMLTMYLNQDDLMRMKLTWKRVGVSINRKPSPVELADAEGRQAVRDSLQGRPTLKRVQN
jgi:hypothetical protein